MMLRMLFVLVILVPMTAHAAIIVSEDYEVTDVDSLAAHGWTVENGTELDGSPVMSIVDAPSGRTGKVLRMQYQGVFVDESHNAKIYRNWAGVPELYERYYVRYDAIDPGQPTGFGSITAKQHYWNYAELPNTGNFFMFGDDQMAMANQSTISRTCPNGTTDSTCNLPQNVGTVHIGYGSWYCVEMHASQTSVEMWIDGTQVIHYDSPTWNSPAIWYYLAIYRQGADNQYRYEDDFVLSTTRVGCEVGGGSTAGGGLDF